MKRFEQQPHRTDNRRTGGKRTRGIFGALAGGLLVGLVIVVAAVALLRPDATSVLVESAQRALMPQEQEVEQEQSSNSDSKAPDPLVQSVYDQLRAQTKTIEFDVWQDSSDVHDYVADAFALNDSDHVGPYVQWSQAGGYTHYINAVQGLTGEWKAHYTIKCDYINASKKEAAFEKQLAQTVKELGLDGEGSSRDKLDAIHEFIIGNVEYGKPDSHTEHTAYSALCRGKAVCQGYATLFYRLAHAAGIKCAIVTGKLEGQDHAWNVVKLGNTWYHVDETACDTNRQYSKYYLVKGKNPSSKHAIGKKDAKKYFG